MNSVVQAIARQWDGDPEALGTRLFSVPRESIARFKMASKRAKWSNYLYIYIACNQGVNTTPFCDGNQAPVLEHQVWRVPLVHRNIVFRGQERISIIISSHQPPRWWCSTGHNWHQLHQQAQNTLINSFYHTCAWDLWLEGSPQGWWTLSISSTRACFHGNIA